MQIFVNEQPISASKGETLFALRDRIKPDADVLIRNGYPLRDDVPLAENDRIVLIRRGETPSADELEALLVSRHTPGVHDRLRQATVGIAGVGGLGSAIAVALARSGVGRLIIADFDVVEPSNLNRQQYFIDQIGLPKVDALRENLRRINPYVKVAVFYGVLNANNLPQAFAAADIIVEAFDDAGQKALLVETVRRQFPQRPLVAASGMAGYSSANSVITRKVGTNFYLCGDGETAAEPGCGLMAPRVGVAAHHQANAVLRLLLGEEP
jgi:sulfur carrier protein ThiS adenylyltransferase